VPNRSYYLVTVQFTSIAVHPATMYSTKSAQSLKKLFSGYHEPLPLSKQQSQKLLDGLKTSFRAQLDREYGRSSTSSSDPAEARAKTTTVARASTSANLTTPRPTRRSAAHQHVKSILSNPLFAYNEASEPTTPSSVAASNRDPMDVFDHAVAKGMMTLRAATGCMIAKRQRSGNADPASMGTSIRVLRWLRSSDAEMSMRFLDHEPFVNALAPFLVMEGREHVAWEWLTRTMNDAVDSITDEQRTKRASVLLSNLVRIKSQPAYGDLNAAISAILGAEQLFKGHTLLPDVLVRPWRSVSWLSTVEASKQKAPSEELFDAHMAAAKSLHRQVSVETAHLHLHHPTHPDYRPALSFFGDMTSLRKLVEEVKIGKIDWNKSRELNILPWISCLGQDTVQRLSQTGHADEARSLTQLLRAAFAGIELNDGLKPA
jgi:hypothetical protein